MPKDESVSHSYQTLIFGVFVSLNTNMKKNLLVAYVKALIFFLVKQKTVMIFSI